MTIKESDYLLSNIGSLHHIIYDIKKKTELRKVLPPSFDTIEFPDELSEIKICESNEDLPKEAKDIKIKELKEELMLVIKELEEI